ncbi:unnamed protein product, partial [Phaeothamnion confervicola]
MSGVRLDDRISPLFQMCCGPLRHTQPHTFRAVWDRVSAFLCMPLSLRASRIHPLSLRPV